jgi:hypothetical protein
MRLGMRLQNCGIADHQPEHRDRLEAYPTLLSGFPALNLDIREIRVDYSVDASVPPG